MSRQKFSGTMISPRSTEIATPTTILIVDDDDALRILTKRYLESKGYTVLEATDGDDALDIVSRNSSVIDLVVCDFILPKTGGHAFASRIVADFPHIRLILVSGYDDRELGIGDLKSRGVHFLAKPFSPRLLASTIDRLLEN